MHSEIENKIVDKYLDHIYHIQGSNGKTVPFFRNMKECSTCFSEHNRIVNRSKGGGFRNYDNITANPEIDGYAN